MIEVETHWWLVAIGYKGDVEAKLVRDADNAYSWGAKRLRYHLRQNGVRLSLTDTHGISRGGPMPYHMRGAMALVGDTHPGWSDDQIRELGIALLEGPLA